MQDQKIDFFVRRAAKDDLETILRIYAGAREFMKKNGNPTQWGNNRPHTQKLISNVENGIQLVCCFKNADGAEEIAATFHFSHGDEESYNHLTSGTWPQGTDDYWCIHSFASSMKVKGTATFCFNWCEKQPGVKCIKIDTHRNNIPMQNLIKKFGFTYCGLCYYNETVQTDAGEVEDFERIAFCKVL